MLHWRMVINNFLIMLRKTAGVKIVQRFVLMRSWRLLDCKSLWGLCDPFGAIWKELQGRKTSLRCFILVKERKKITECFNRKHYFYSFQIQVHLDQNCGCCLWGASTWQVWLSSCTNTYHAVASIQLQKKKKKRTDISAVCLQPLFQRTEFWTQSLCAYLEMCNGEDIWWESSTRSSRCPYFSQNA